MTDFQLLPAEFITDRIYVCPITVAGEKLKLYTDSGGGGMFLEPHAVDKLGMHRRRAVFDGQEYEVVDFPMFREDACIPPGEASSEFIVLEGDGEQRDGFLGQSWFADRVRKFDYVKRQLWYWRRPGPRPARHPKRHSAWNSVDESERLESYEGTPMPVFFRHDEDGRRTVSFARVQAQVDGETIDFLFDTGATAHLSSFAQGELSSSEPLYATCFITARFFDKWCHQHPEWRFLPDADTLTGEPMLEVPQVTFAGYTVGPVWFTRRQDRNFHEYMSQWMDTQIDGALGGSLFKYFSLVLDYPNSTLYVSHHGRSSER